VSAQNRSVLAIEAHPDDMEFMCSGALYLLSQKGYSISVCCIANGDCGSTTEPPETITKIRRQEAMNAAELLKASFYPVGERDLRVYFNDSTVMKVTECIGDVDPLIVFTHPHEDYMADHEMTSRILRDACFSAPIPNYTTHSIFPEPWISAIPYSYYWSPLEGKNIYGDFVDQRIYIDITGIIDIKARMLACHKSQRDWLMKQHHMDKYIETMRTTAKRYGEASGFEYAEGFTQHLGNAYPQKSILKTILGDLLKDRKEGEK
jgi:LmbE family N-acetylglucosaminyl deacetylase